MKRYKKYIAPYKGAFICGPILMLTEVAGVLSPQQEGTYISVDGKQYLQTGYVSEQTGYYFGMLTDKIGRASCRERV